MNNEVNFNTEIQEDVVKKKGNISKVIIFLLIILLVVLGTVCAYFANQLQLEKDKQGSTSNTIKSNEDNACNCNRSEREKENMPLPPNDSGHISYAILSTIGRGKDNVKYDYNYFNDYNVKFLFVYNLAYNFIEMTRNGIDGEEATGAGTYKLDEFKSLYRKLFNEEFDYTKLNQDSSYYNLVYYPQIKDGYLYGVFATGTVPPRMSYEYKSEYLKDDFRLTTFDAQYEGVDSETGELKYEDMGKVELTFIVKDGYKVFKSLIFKK